MEKISGLTLIETILYTFIVSAVIAAMLLIISGSLVNSSRLYDAISVTESKQFIEQKLDWVLAGVSVVNSPAANTTGTILSVNKINFSSNPVVIDASGATLRIKQGSGNYTALTPPSITISALVFGYNSTTTGASVFVTATLSGSQATTAINYTKILR